MFRFREEQYEDDDELLLAMSELRQRRVELDMTFDEFHTVWILDTAKVKEEKEYGKF